MAQQRQKPPLLVLNDQHVRMIKYLPTTLMCVVVWHCLIGLVVLLVELVGE